MADDRHESTNAPAVLTAGAVPSDLTDRLRALRDALLTGLVERDVEIRLALLAALAGEHLLLIGPPGTAKSLLARRLSVVFRGASYFERLLTRFTVPEELFGPLSIKALEEDRYHRQTECYLPTASIAFLDEIFKANSAILNALLTLLNEREFDNGTVRTKTPLISVIGASNELPEGEELDALFDRFLLRLHVGPVSSEGFTRLLALRGDPPLSIPEHLRLTVEDLRQVQSAAEGVEIPDDLAALLCELREWRAAEQIAVSDRRWRKIVKLLQVSALTNGRTTASVWDAWLLQHCVWSEPEQREKVYEWYAARVGASAATDSTRLTAIVVAFENQLKLDQDSQSQAKDSEGRRLFMSPTKERVIDEAATEQVHNEGQPMFLAPLGARSNSYGSAQISDRSNGGRGYSAAELSALNVDGEQFRYWDQREKYMTIQANWLMKERKLPPFMEPTRHKPIYVDRCIADIDSHREVATAHQTSLREHIDVLEAEIRNHLWVTSEFAAPASEALQRTAANVRTLLGRLDALRSGYLLLPREGANPLPPPRAATFVSKKGRP